MKKLSRIVLEIEVPEPSSYGVPSAASKHGLTPEQVMLHRWQNDAEDLTALLQRRMDDLEVSGRRYEFICSSCGSPWTEESGSYNGGCCEEDEKNSSSQSSKRVCEDCGTPIIDNCIRCGAPQCCPKCCP